MKPIILLLFLLFSVCICLVNKGLKFEKLRTLEECFKNNPNLDESDVEDVIKGCRSIKISVVQYSHRVKHASLFLITDVGKKSVLIDMKYWGKNIEIKNNFTKDKYTSQYLITPRTLRDIYNMYNSITTQYDEKSYNCYNFADELINLINPSIKVKNRVTMWDASRNTYDKIKYFLDQPVY